MSLVTWSIAAYGGAGKDHHFVCHKNVEDVCVCVFLVHYTIWGSVHSAIVDTECKCSKVMMDQALGS